MKDKIKQIMDSIKPIKEVKLWNNGYVQMCDFSKANSSEEHRIAHVCHVANVCRGDKGVKDPKELYQKLLTEHDGKPGSVFEFVPVIANLSMTTGDYKNVQRFGIFRGKTDGLKSRWLTNLRAMIPDVDSMNDRYVHQTKIEYNNEPIKDFFVFKLKIPMMIVPHILRHRAFSFMQVSERTQKLREYYYCDELEQLAYKGMYKRCGFLGYQISASWNFDIQHLSQYDFDDAQSNYSIRQELTNEGSHGLAYTTLWIAAWKQNTYAWDNFFAVRTKKPAQREIIELAKTMKQMMEE